jgi:hypothetical protein
MTAPKSPHREDKTPVPVPTDDAIEMLNNSRRRLVIVLLDELGPRLTVDDAAQAIAAIEHDCPIADLGSQQRKRVYISLIQSHLPRLDRTGIVQYEEGRKILTATKATAPMATVARCLNQVCET